MWMIILLVLLLGRSEGTTCTSLSGFILMKNLNAINHSQASVFCSSQRISGSLVVLYPTISYDYNVSPLWPLFSAAMSDCAGSSTIAQNYWINGPTGFSSTCSVYTLTGIGYTPCYSAYNFVLCGVIEGTQTLTTTTTTVYVISSTSQTLTVSSTALTLTTLHRLVSTTFTLTQNDVSTVLTVTSTTFSETLSVVSVSSSITSVTSTVFSVTTLSSTVSTTLTFLTTITSSQTSFSTTVTTDTIFTCPTVNN